MKPFAGWILLLSLCLEGCKEASPLRPADSREPARSDVVSRAPADPEDARLKDVVAQFHAMSVSKRGPFLRQLSERRDVAGLTAIARTDDTFATDAAGEAVQLLPSENVVAYIKQFPPGSSAWRDAMYSTGMHPKEAIIGYVIEVSQQVDSPKVQTCCYDVCKERGWADLKAAAQAARNDQRAITIANWGPETVAEAAGEYLKSLEKSQRE